MKKLLRGIKSSVDRKVDHWLHKEEYQAQKQQMEVAMAELDEVLRPVKEFVDALLREDLDTKPTGRDIDRYFVIYKGAMEGKKLLMEQVGVWSQDIDEPILTAEQYEEKAQADGWKFLRGSIGLPLCDLNKPRPDAWRTPPARPHSVPEKQGWESDEKSVDNESKV